MNKTMSKILQEKINQIKELHRIQNESTTPNALYDTGLFNGLELALTVLEDREPVYRQLREYNCKTCNKNIKNINNEVVCVTGPIGAGKSYFLDALRRLFPEIPVWNKTIQGRDLLIEFYYKDKKYWTPSFQHLSFDGKLYNLIKAREEDGVTVTERDIEDNCDIFALAQHEEGYSDNESWEMYKTIYNFIFDRISQPNVYIYLKATSPFLFKRIHTIRKRPGEENITMDYLQGINKRYNEWIEKIKERGERVVTIQVDHDFSDEEIETIFYSAIKSKQRSEYSENAHL